MKIEVDEEHTEMQDLDKACNLMQIYSKLDEKIIKLSRFESVKMGLIGGML